MSARIAGPVTVFGGAGIDHIAATRDAPVMGVSNPGTARTAPGGVGFNVATVLARLGHPVRMVGRIGADRAGETVRAAAVSAGVDVTHLAVSQTAPTAGYLAALDEKGNLIIGIAAMAVDDEMRPETLGPAVETAPPNDFWVLDANLPAETIGYLIEKAKESGHRLAAMPVSPAKCLKLKPYLADLGLLFVNRKEAATLLGRPGDGKDTGETVVDLARALAGSPAGQGGPDVVVTDAGNPLAIASNGDIRTVDPLPAAIRSVNGAGDALAAGTIAGLASGLPLTQAIRSGLAAAAITVEHEGTVPPTLTAEAVAARLAAAEEGT